LAVGQSSGLSRVSSNGGPLAPLTKLNPGERTHRWPQVLPGSRAVLFTAHNSNDYDQANIDVVSLKTGERKTVQRGGHSPHYLALPNGTGRLLYVNQDALFAAPFDPDRLVLAGAATPILEDIASGGLAAHLCFSQNGTFVYQVGKGRLTGGTT